MIQIITFNKGLSKLSLPPLFTKELSLCHKHEFSHPYIIEAQCRRQIFQTIYSVRLNNLSLKYLRITPSGCKNIGMGKFKFVAKTQFLYLISHL